MSVWPPRDHLRSFYPDFQPNLQIKAIRAMLALFEAHGIQRYVSLDALVAKANEHSDFELRTKADHEAGEYFEVTGYLQRAYSMGAVGMLAPFIETIFKQAFEAMAEQLFSQLEPLPHDRWKMPETERWDCSRYVIKEGKSEKGIVKGILQLSDALGLRQYLPDDFGPRIDALFSYRNAMFHNGFEWPKKERLKFATTIRKKKWPNEWFAKAMTNEGFKDEEVWFFTLSDTFISETIDWIEKVLDGLGSFVGEKRKALEELKGNDS
jgi:hypothetical protein